MKIYIIRHAIAALRETWAQPDETRPVTRAGRKKMKRVARGLEQLGFNVSQLYSSPLVRAQQTAQIVQQHFRLSPAVETKLLLPEAQPEQFLPFLNQHENAAALALVGHEPHVSALLAYLLTGATHANLPFKKGGVALVESATPIIAGQCVLRWFMTPRALSKLGAK